MAYRLPAHLHRNRCGILYFRLSVPNDLQPLLGQREIYRSLNTASVREAANSAQALWIAFRSVFDDLRTQTMAEDQEEPVRIDPDRLKVEMRHAKEKLYLRDRIDELEAREFEIARQRIKDRQQHERVRQHDREQHEREISLVIAAKGGASTQPATSGGGKTISQAWEGYRAEKITAKAWRDGEDTAKYDHWPHVRTLIEVIGDKPLAEITADDANKFQSHVLTDPDGGSPRNRDKRLTRAGAVLRWAKSKRYITDDFAELLRYPGKIVANPYVAFDTDDLKALFESDKYQNRTFKTPSEYWLPIIGLHTGARINELCQLAAADIGAHNGIPTISVLDNDGKRLKTTASRRIVPIHSTLIALGFLDYVANVGAGRIFPELPEDPKRKGNFGAKATELFTAYRRRCGVGEAERRSNKAFHSFRTTLISALRKADVPKDRRTRLAGHEYDDTQDKTYHGGDVLTMFDIATLKADIERVRFEIRFTPFFAAQSTNQTDPGDSK